MYSIVITPERSKTVHSRGKEGITIGLKDRTSFSTTTKQRHQLQATTAPSYQHPAFMLLVERDAQTSINMVSSVALQVSGPLLIRQPFFSAFLAPMRQHMCYSVCASCCTSIDHNRTPTRKPVDHFFIQENAKYCPVLRRKPYHSSLMNELDCSAKHYLFKGCPFRKRKEHSTVSEGIGKWNNK
jgi:hypothetical protein